MSYRPKLLRFDRPVSFHDVAEKGDMKISTIRAEGREGGDIRTVYIYVYLCKLTILTFSSVSLIG